MGHLWTFSPSGRCRAFSLIELVVVLGVLMVLAGLMLPALGGAMEEARLTRDAALLRQHGISLGQYREDNESVYPIARDNPFVAGQVWFLPMIEKGYIMSAAELDPLAGGDLGRVRFAMSVCMVYDPDLMLRGKTLPAKLARSVPVRDDQVHYPSDKGELLRNHNGMGHPREGGLFFCCTHAWRSAVAMADGSISTGDMFDFTSDTAVELENLVGMPVRSSWNGYRARDRR